MNKIKYILIFILLAETSCFYSQEEASSAGCSIFLEPIIMFDLAIGERETDILQNVDNYERLTGEDLKYKPKDIEAYAATKRIRLPNGYKSEVKFYFQFKDGLLSTYNLNFDIGADYEYFWELISYLEKSDKLKINSFIYSSLTRKPYHSDLSNKDCKRIFRVTRDQENNSIFEITCKVN